MIGLGSIFQSSVNVLVYIAHLKENYIGTPDLTIQDHDCREWSSNACKIEAQKVEAHVTESMKASSRTRGQPMQSFHVALWQCVTWETIKAAYHVQQCFIIIVLPMLHIELLHILHVTDAFCNNIPMYFVFYV